MFSHETFLVFFRKVYSLDPAAWTLTLAHFAHCLRGNSKFSHLIYQQHKTFLIPVSGIEILDVRQLKYINISEIKAY